MIAGLSKAVTLYLSPLLALTAIVLSLLAFLAPSMLLHDKVALLTVTPSLVLLQAGPAQSVDGPSLFLGALGSCSRTLNAEGVSCTNPGLSPIYDLSVLPKSAPSSLLSAPTTATPAAIAVGILFSVVFFITFTGISFRHKMGTKLSAILEKPAVQRFAAWLGFFSFVIGLTSFLILRFWFEKAIQDFNNTVALQGKDAPKLVADAGNGFTMIWVAHAFYGVPVVISLAKLNVKATK